jgi:hypothetical protein
MARERERRMDGWMDASRRRRMLGEGRRGPAAAEGVGERERGVGIGRGALKEIAPSPPPSPSAPAANA